MTLPLLSAELCNAVVNIDARRGPQLDCAGSCLCKQGSGRGLWRLKVCRGRDLQRAVVPPPRSTVELAVPQPTAKPDTTVIVAWSRLEQERHPRCLATTDIWSRSALAELNFRTVRCAQHSMELK